MVVIKGSTVCNEMPIKLNQQKHIESQSNQERLPVIPLHKMSNSSQLFFTVENVWLNKQKKILN